MLTAPRRPAWDVNPFSAGTDIANRIEIIASTANISTKVKAVRL
jgi:hypothetical protein